jgi:hypothetical protein
VKLSGALNDVLIKNRSWLAAGINQMRELALIPVVCLLRGKGLRPSDYPESRGARACPNELPPAESARANGVCVGVLHIFRWVEAPHSVAEFKAWRLRRIGKTL